jgi:transposase-like protein
MDETYIRVNGDWKYLYRAVDKQGQTVDSLLTAKRNAAAAKRFFEKAMRHTTVPDKVTMDKSDADQTALEHLNKEREVSITIWQVKYLNNIVEQDHRAIKRITRPVLGFKSLRAACAILAGIEPMHMIRKVQFMLKD